MQLVETWTEIRKNIQTFNSYRTSQDLLEQEFFIERLRLGKCFVALETDAGILFGPSRFIGYVDNTLSHHAANESKHGWDTNAAIEETLGPCKVDPSVDEQYLKLCQRHKILPADNVRKYWYIPRARDFLAE